MFGFFKKAAAPKYITESKIQIANAAMMIGVRRPPCAETQDIVNRLRPTPEKMAEARQHAWQKLEDKIAAEGGPWWQRDPAFLKELKAARGERHLSLVKGPDAPSP